MFVVYISITIYWKKKYIHKLQSTKHIFCNPFYIYSMWSIARTAFTLTLFEQFVIILVSVSFINDIDCFALLLGDRKSAKLNYTIYNLNASAINAAVSQYSAIKITYIYQTHHHHTQPRSPTQRNLALTCYIVCGLSSLNRLRVRVMTTCNLLCMQIMVDICCVWKST